MTSGHMSYGHVDVTTAAAAAAPRLCQQSQGHQVVKPAAGYSGVMLAGSRGEHQHPNCGGADSRWAPRCVLAGKV